MTAKQPHILIVEAPYYREIADKLSVGAIAALEAAGATFEVKSVPGALEIPAVISLYGERFDGFVALGCVVRGQTSHYDIVAGESARAIMDLTVGRNLAIGNGILTVDSQQQALVRADPEQKNKGRDAVAACLALIEAKQQLS